MTREPEPGVQFRREMSLAGCLPPPPPVTEAGRDRASLEKDDREPLDPRTPKSWIRSVPSSKAPGHWASSLRATRPPSVRPETPVFNGNPLILSIDKPAFWVDPDKSHRFPPEPRNDHGRLSALTRLEAHPTLDG